ncbi:MAG: CDP-diacylglycerol--serine O-phosphatidyltransferase [Phycisphaerae bacterium]|nr:MAG: CDP-diacylglycerol--serine O-phosphatidyltransferase [Phycisphaerae bacterium]
MFLKLGPRQSEFPAAVLIPNMLTTLALCSGLAAIHYALKPDWDRALAAVFLAGIFDALDGRAARLLRVTSGFGAILDSLSDFLSFGVAPAIILHQWLAGQDQLVGRSGLLSLAAFMTYALGAAIRLARFTSEPHPPKPAKGGVESVAPFFRGMPSPAAAGIALVPLFLANSRYWPDAWDLPGWAVVLNAFLIGVLMVTRVPMYSLKALRVTRRAVAPLLVGVGLLAAAMLKDPLLTIAGLGIVYAVSVPITAVLWWRVGRAAVATPETPAERTPT